MNGESTVHPEHNPYRVIIDDRRPGEKDVYMSYTPTTVQLAGSDIVWLAGTTALPLYHQHPHDPADLAALPPDAYSQTKLALAGVERQLESVGARWTDLVRLNIYVVKMEENREGVNQALSEVLDPHFPHPQGIGSPGGTMMGVELLIDAGNLVEIEGVAVVPPDRRVGAVRAAAEAIGDLVD